MRTASRLVTCALLAFSLSAARFGEALTVRQLSLPELTSLAHRIVRGRCVGVRTQGRGPGRVMAVKIAVDEMLKGPAASVLTFRQLAGGGLTELLPRWSVGESLLVFLHEDSDDGLTSPVGLAQGVIPLVEQRAAETEPLLASVRALVAAEPR